MKAFTKFCLILSGVLILFGLAGIGIGLAMGVKPDQILDRTNYSDKFNFPKPITEKLREVDDDLSDIPSLSGKPSEDADEYYEFDNTIDNLNFKLNFCDLKIYPHDEDFIALEAWNTGNTFRCDRDEHTLKLEDNRKKVTFQDSMDYALYLKLYLPKKLLNDVYIEVGVGNVTLEQLSAANAELNCGVGELTAGALSGEDIDLHLGIGTLNADLIAADECSIESGTGNIAIGKFDGADLDLNCGIGDASVTAVGKPTQYNYELNCTAGEIRLNRQLYTADSHHEETHGIGCHLDIDNHADRELSIQCGTGDLELNFTEED